MEVKAGHTAYYVGSLCQFGKNATSFETCARAHAYFSLCHGEF